LYLTSSEAKSLLGLLQTLNSEAAPETRRIGAGRFLLGLDFNSTTSAQVQRV
jgi:hypothetical protein